ncbi:MAG: serine hydrolase [Acidimicrobiia bacterium]|nr:serine hydrolase [Acidimicrobiia bacterium]
MVRGLRVLVAALLIGAALPVAAAGAHDGHGAGPHPGAWILVDADTGAVLSAHNIHEALPPASVVKVMTALVALEQAPLDSDVTVSAEAAGRPARRIAMVEGQVWPLGDALASMLIVSANDAAYAVAESVSGDLDSFAADAQRIGARYGMQDSVLRDPAGLDDDTFAHDGGSRFSAYDLAIAARNLLEVPELAQFPPMETYEFIGPDGIQHRLLGQNLLIGTYDGATGLKTGSTDLAGNTLIASAEREGRTMIAVVLNDVDTYGTATRLLDEGFTSEPGAAGTGEQLPAPAVTTRDARSAFLDALPAPLEPLAAASFAAAISGYEPVASEPGSTTASADAGTGSEGSAGDGDSGVDSPWLWALVAALAVGLFFIVSRRRSVLARRRVRDARRRELAEARRRGTVHIVESAGGPPAGERVRKHPSMRSPSQRSSNGGTSNGGKPRVDTSR